MRAVRALRPLRTINRLPGMRRQVATLIESIPHLVDVALLRAAAAGARRAHLATERAETFFASLGFASLASLPETVAARLPETCHQAAFMSRPL